MSQGTLQVANQGFPGFRTDLNAGLAALNSKNSGTAAPSALAAGQSWIDTSTGTRPVLKQYDGADWIEVTSFDTNANRAYRGTQYATAGGSGSPSFSFEGDPDTGWYRKASNSIGEQVGGVDVRVIGTGGEHIMPRQPAFLVAKTSASTNQTGNGGTSAIIYNSEVFDQGGNVVSGTFMAPVPGKYRFEGAVTMNNFGVGATNGLVQLVTTNATYEWREQGIPTSNVNQAFRFSTLTNMDAGDTAFTRAIVNGMAGNTVSVDGQSTRVTFFSGKLEA